MDTQYAKGFSLIELLIAVSIFLIITVAAIGSMIHLQGAAQRSEATYATLDNLNLTMDNMTRLVRTGTNFHCGLSGDLAAPADCPYRGNAGDGQTGFAFTSQDGKRIQYQLNGDSVEMKEDSGAWFRITDDNISVDRFRIYVEGAASGDTKQPYALLVMSGKVALGSQMSDFHLQTTMTQRLPDGSLTGGSVASGDTQDPTVPTGLAGTAVSSSQIDLTWNPSADNVGVTGYKIYRNSIQVGVAPAPGTTFSDTGLSPNTTYTYTVAAFDAADNTSLSSAPINRTTQASPDTTAPSVPTNLSATAAPGQITVSWTASTDSGSGMSNYRLERCATAGCTNFAQIAAPTGTSYVDTTGLNPGTTYRYRVRAEDNASNLSGYSALASAVARAASITMGETAILATNDTNNGNRLVSYSTTLSQNGTIQSLSFYVTTVSGNLRLGVYDNNGPGGGPGTKLAETASFAPVAGWNTQAVVTPVSLTAGTYWLAYLPSSFTLGFRMATTGTAKYYTYTFGPMPATFSTTPTTGTFHWSFYATLNTN